WHPLPLCKARDRMAQELGHAPQVVSGLARELLPVLGRLLREPDPPVGLGLVRVEDRRLAPRRLVAQRLPERGFDLEVLEEDELTTRAGGAQPPRQRPHERAGRRLPVVAEELAADQPAPTQGQP